MLPDEGERIRRFVEGLRDSLFSQVGSQMDIFPSNAVVVDIARRMEARNKNREDLNKKRNRGRDGRSYSCGGNLGASMPQNMNQSTQVASSGPAPSSASVSQSHAEFKGANLPLVEGVYRRSG